MYLFKVVRRTCLSCYKFTDLIAYQEIHLLRCMNSLKYHLNSYGIKIYIAFMMYKCLKLLMCNYRLKI